MADNRTPSSVRGVRYGKELIERDTGNGAGDVAAFTPTHRFGQAMLYSDTRKLLVTLSIQSIMGHALML